MCLLHQMKPTTSIFHDVFVSFRGPDVRNGFKDHLFAALRRQGVTVFSDDEADRGHNVDEAVRRAIDVSSFYVVVLSRTYASSRHCLDELVRIMTHAGAGAGDMCSNCCPVFYDVSPNDLSRCFGKDLDRHKREFSYETVDQWIRALTWIAGIAGWVFTSTSQSEAVLVEEIASTMRHKVQQLTQPPSAAASPPWIWEHPSDEPKYDPVSLVAQLFAGAQSGKNRPNITAVNSKVKVKAAGDTKNNTISTTCGIYVFEFPDREASDMALESSPWYIAGSLIFLGKLLSDPQPPFCAANNSMANKLLSEEERNTVPVWVRLYGVPEEHMNARALSCIASAVGTKPLYKDDGETAGLFMMRFKCKSSRPFFAARMCVEMRDQ